MGEAPLEGIADEVMPLAAGEGLDKNLIRAWHD
jgi:hypothetical protein